jgi:DNA modification methylase
MAQVATMLHGDALATLRTLPAESVHCCVTSPPYWGLRQYLFDGASQIRYDIPHEKRQEIEAELAKRGIKPRAQS